MSKLENVKIINLLTHKEVTEWRKRRRGKQS